MTNLKRKIAAIIAATVVVSSIGVSATSYDVSGKLTKYDSNTKVKTINLDVDYGAMSLTGTNSSLAAVYDPDGVMVDAAMVDVTDGKASYDINVVKDSNYKVKTFLWEKDSQMPLCDANEYTENEIEDMISVYRWDFEDSTLGEKNGGNAWTYATAYLNNNVWSAMNPIVVDVTDNTVTNTTSTWANDKIYEGVDVKSENSLKCAKIETMNGSGGHIGMRVEVSNKNLEPNRKYVMSFYTRNNVTTRGIYTHLEPKTITRSNYSDEYGYKNLYGISWLQGKTTAIGTENESVPNNSEYTKVFDAITKEEWSKVQVGINPTENDFDEDGNAYLYIMFTRNPIYANSTNNMKDLPLGNGNAFYIDDIEIKAVRGKDSWQFEDSTDISDGNELDKWTHGFTTTYGVESGVQYIKPTVAEKTSTSSVTRTAMKLTNPASDGTATHIGAKIKLSNTRLQVGKTYKIGFNWLTEMQYAGVSLKLMPASDWTYNASNWTGAGNATFAWDDCYAANKNVKLPWVNDSSVTPTIVKPTIYKDTANEWYWGEMTITPTAEDFDENGYTNLWLVVVQKNVENRYLTAGASFYFDNIVIQEQK